MDLNVKLSNDTLRALQEIDEMTIRPLRAILSGTDTEEDHKTLEALEQQALNLRKELVTTNK